MGGNESPLGLRKQNGGIRYENANLHLLSFERFHHN